MGINWKGRDSIKYDYVDSVLAAVRRSVENPKAPCELSGSSDEDGWTPEIAGMYVDIDVGVFAEPSGEPTAGTSSGQLTAPSESPPSALDTSSTYRPERVDLQRLGEPILITQRDFDNIAKEAQLSERQKEIVGSRLSDHNIMAADFKITAGRKCRKVIH